MGTDKRERQKENRRARLEAEAEAWRRRQRNRRILWVLVLALVVGLVVVVVNVFGDDEDEPDLATGDAAAASSTTAPPGDTTTPEPAAPAVAPPPGEALTGETPCPAADGSSPRTTSFANPPPMCLDEGVAYDAVVTTDVGELTIQLDAERAPQTVNNFVVLARYHYFDGVPFHRVIPDFVVQGGDAVGDPLGTGGPGYAIPDELPESVDDYVEGSVAMANSGPDTGGSQWFIWFGPNPLPAPDYALFGQVTEGLDVADAIRADGSPDGTPAVVHTIESVQVVERGAPSAGG